MKDLISESNLMQAFGYERRADLIKCLRAQGIKYYLGKGGAVVTTLQALNAPLIGQSENEKQRVDFL